MVDPLFWRQRCPARARLLGGRRHLLWKGRPSAVRIVRQTFVVDDEARERLRHRVRETFPARRIGSVDDVGHAAVFLMINPYVTGTVLEVTGGEQFAEPLRF